LLQRQGGSVAHCCLRPRRRRSRRGHVVRRPCQPPSIPSHYSTPSPPTKVTTIRPPSLGHRQLPHPSLHRRWLIVALRGFSPSHLPPPPPHLHTLTLLLRCRLIVASRRRQLIVASRRCRLIVASRGFSPSHLPPPPPPLHAMMLCHCRLIVCYFIYILRYLFHLFTTRVRPLARPSHRCDTCISSKSSF